MKKEKVTNATVVEIPTVRMDDGSAVDAFIQSMNKKVDNEEKDTSEQDLEETVDDTESDETLEQELEDSEETKKGLEDKTSKSQKTTDKRYDDLKSWIDKQKNSWDEEKKKILAENEALKKEKALPFNRMSKEELKDYSKKYPDLYKSQMSVLAEALEERDKDLQTRFKKMEEFENEIRIKENFSALKGIHPDVDKIVKGSDFEEWLGEQTSEIQSIASNSGDYRSVAKVISLYKMEKGIPLPVVETKNKQKAASKTVSKSSKTNYDPNDKTTWWSESKFNKLSEMQAIKLLPEVQEAMRKGRFIYDMSQN